MTTPVARAVFGLLFENSTEVVLVVDRAQGRVVCANVPAAELLVTTVETLEGCLFDELTLERRDLSAAGHYEEIGLVRSDGYPVFVEMDIVHVEDPVHGSLAAVIARDTTERRSLQVDLQLKHSALIAAHAELEARNQQIATLAWRAAMAELVAGIAHHLNNPVAALSSTVGQLRGKLAGLPEGSRAELTRLVERVGKIATRIELNVGEIVRVTQGVTRSGPSALPPELADDVHSFVAKLDNIPTKDSV